MHALLDRSVVLGIGLMIALLGVGAVGSYRNIQSVQRQSLRVNHTYEIDRMAAEVRRLAMDAVIHERSYEIQGQPASAKKSRDTLGQLFVHLRELQWQTADNPNQQRRVEALTTTANGLNEQLTRAMELKASGAEPSELLLLSAEVDQQLDAIRDQVAAIRSEEVTLLQEREEEVSGALRTALLSGVVLFGLGLALFMGIIELIRRNSAFQRRQQERLFAEREQLAVTLASIDDGVISVDRQGRISHWNGQAEQLTGHLRETAVGLSLQSILRLVDELTNVPFTIPLDEILTGGVSARFDAPLLVTAADGKSHPVALQASPILDNVGSINGAVLILRQLSEERRAEIAKTERARILSIRADVGLIISHAGRTEDQLQQCVQSIGQQLSAVAVGLWSITEESPTSLRLAATWKQPGWSFVEGLSSPPPNSAIAASLKDRRYATQPCPTEDCELQTDLLPDPRTEVTAWACPLTIEDRVLGVLTIYTFKQLSDLSSSELSLVTAKLAQFIERRAIEEARQESAELFRTLANSIPQLAWMARPDGYVFWYNQRWFDYTGSTPEQMQGAGWQSVHDPHELPHVLESQRRSFATGEPWEDTFPLRRHDGEFRWHLSRMLPVRDDHGRIRLWFGTNTDVTEQRNAEQRLRRVIDSIFAFVGIIAPDGTLIEVNQAPLAVAGLSREDVIGRAFWDCPWFSYDEDLRARVRQAFEQARTGQLVRYDEEIRLAGSASITMDLMLQPVFDDDKLVFVIPSGVDVTARKQAEERVALSEEFLRSVLDALASHIAVLDEHGTILMVNHAWKSFAESNRLELSNYAVGQNYLAVSAPPDSHCSEEAQAASNGIREVIEGVRPWYSMEYPCHSPLEQRWFLMRVDRFTSLNSTRVVVSHENITSRVVSEESTRRWSAQQQRLAEIAIGLSAAENMDAALKVVTEGARRLIESADAQIVYARSGDELSHFRAASLDENAAEYQANPQHSEWVVQRVRKTNRPLRMAARSAETAADPEAGPADASSCLAAPLTARDGRNIGLIQLRGKLAGVYTADDESILIQLAQMASIALERARLYDEILTADQRKDQFLATLAHELRNPLSALTSGSQLILMQPEDVDHVKSTAALVARQCSHLKQLVDDLLDVSRISRGKLNLQRAPTSLQEVMQHAIETAQASITAGGHQLSTQITNQPLHVHGDAVRLAQVVSNLLVNAAKYTPPGGKIELELSSCDNQAVISVRDNGIGIPPEMADRIFELFTQVDSSHTRSQGGLGIGLTLARTLVTMHGGKIEVSSPGANLGSVFTVRLPLISVNQADTDQLQQPPLASAPTKTHRILIVDDNRAAVFLLARLLSTMGHTVQTASDGQSALAAVTEFQPEVVISDIGMPDMNGYELAQRVLQIDSVPKPVLVALTGYGQATDRQEAFNAGFRHHLTKPVGLADLDSLMQSL
ncbi:MAG TPA: PAS domain S-box protein [Planctomycetaceae bacterium]|nr:PAS domain S-box protein [Planctomycetaceae bacterium]